MSKSETKEATIRQLYTELNKYCSSADYDKALKAANKIIGLDATEWKAAKCKLACLIQNGKFEEAIKFIERGTSIPDTTFEKAYSEYRLNRAEDAFRTIQAVAPGGGGGADQWAGLAPNLKELLAQILYRLERFDECFELYRNIIKNTHDDYDDERRTNMSAVAANQCIVGSGGKQQSAAATNLPEDTYELTYNAACALAGRREYGEAERKLRTSEKMCRDSLEEDGASEEDIIDEITIIKVQLAYCLQMQGRVKEASALYADALRHKTNDVALTAVVSNNLVVINRDQNVFDSRKKMKVATSEQADQKLTSRQRKTIAFNNCLLAYFASPSECGLLASRLANAHPDLEFQSLLVRVSQLARDKKYREAVELLEAYAQRLPAGRTTELLQVRFAIVQLQLVAGNRKAAIETLESLGEARYQPGVVSALVTLHLGLDNKQAASEILKSAVEWYKRQKSATISDSDLSDMWRQAASFHLRGGEPETAAKSLEELLRTHPNDMKLLAQLVIAYAQFDPKRAQQASKRLPALETLTTVSEIDALEATNWMMIAKAVKRKPNQPAGGGRTTGDQSPGAGTPSAEQQQQAARKQKRKKRKGKLPKNYIIGVLPDPERWLPRYERTGYRKKRDRRVKEIIKGSQGTASGQADQFDMSKAYNQTKNSPATPGSGGVTQLEQNAAAAAATRQLPRKSQHKKKKGKH
ncbi:signal recognition particle subunit SRP72 [Anopheles gambiae]|uniref:signal recognition particle subunit SRP72 n=1 Tax=Anopheles coluzzii TaxID=1518534 RepID=UPI0020FFBB75|nr:signal recognition particle subunit SRP72 [Anopheles coluzzii]XP_321122.5 signal recognition particle subunit SRP72 [Anopheles gambiae]